MGTLADLLKDSRFWKDTGQGLTDSVNRGAIAGLLGGPVDAVSGVVNAGLMGLGYAGNKMGLLGADRMPQPIQKPVGGSEWIGDLLQRGGMVTDNRNAPAEMLAGLLAPSAVKGAGKAAFAAENNAMAPTPLNNAYRGQLGATVWHGSPHKFDKFDSSKIGTGEGAQAYGHGLYLAESPAVAGQYKKTLSADGFLVGDKVFDPSSLGHLNVRNMARSGDIDSAIAKAQEIAASNSPVAGMAANDLKMLLDAKAKGGLQKNPGSLYKVDLPDEHIAKMLDWDKPLSGQAPHVRSALENSKNKHVQSMLAYANSPYTTPGIENEVKTMGEALRVMSMNFSGKASADSAKASQLLAKAGIPGVRYLDGGSRNAGQGTSNYVVFPGNEGLLSILERNGQPIK